MCGLNMLFCNARYWPMHVTTESRSDRLHQSECTHIQERVPIAPTLNQMQRYTNIGSAVRAHFRRLYPANANTPTCCPSDDNRTKVTNSVTSARSLWWHVGPRIWRGRRTPFQWQLSCHSFQCKVTPYFRQCIPSNFCGLSTSDFTSFKMFTSNLLFKRMWRPTERSPSPSKCWHPQQPMKCGGRVTQGPGQHVLTPSIFRRGHVHWSRSLSWQHWPQPCNRKLCCFGF